AIPCRHRPAHGRFHIEQRSRQPICATQVSVGHQTQNRELNSPFQLATAPGFALLSIKRFGIAPMMQLFLPLVSRRKAERRPERIVVSCANEAFEIAVQRHPRARRYTLRVREKNRDVVLTIPPRGSYREARAFAERNAAWIAARVKRIPSQIPF